MPSIWDDPNYIAKLLSGAYAAPAPSAPVATIAPPAPQPGGYPDDPAYAAQTAQFGAQQNVINARYGVNTASQAALSGRYGVNAAAQSMVPFTMATLMANRNVLGSRAGTFGPQQAVINANYGVNQAQGAQVAGQRNFLGKQQQEVATQRSEYDTQVAAENNVADQTAVATFSRYRAAKDSRDRALGITPSVEINAPAGSISLDGDIAPGVRAKATTQAEDVAKVNKENQARRGFDMESAKLVVQLMGTDVDQARLVAAQAGLTLDQAQLAVSQAENAAGFTQNREQTANVGLTQARLAAEALGLDAESARLDENLATIGESQATLNSHMADRAPFPGAERYTDPYTGQRTWMTPSEADHLKYQYETDLSVSRIPTQQAVRDQAKLYDTQQGAGGSPLAALSTAQLLNMYADPNTFQAPWFQGTKTNAIKTELIRRLVKQGYPQATAESAAAQLIDFEMQRRQQAARSGRPTTTDSDDD